MVQFYKLAHPGVSSISVDGVEHTVNDAGHLEVETTTPNLNAALKHHGAVAVTPEAAAAAPIPQLTAAEAAEREALFTELETALGRRIDRRRSLQQLRAMKADHNRTTGGA